MWVCVLSSFIVRCPICCYFVACILSTVYKYDEFDLYVNLRHLIFLCRLMIHLLFVDSSADKQDGGCHKRVRANFVATAKLGIMARPSQ